MENVVTLNNLSYEKMILELRKLVFKGEKLIFSLSDGNFWGLIQKSISAGREKKNE